MKKEASLYWAVYKNLEKDVIDLSYQIHFDDKQLKTYSIKIADLIFRCSTELEAIAKDIYREIAKEEPENSGNCFLFLEKCWKISKKVVIISAVNFHFNEKFVPHFAPFDYKKDSENDYFKAYCSIKHDRVKNLEKANINILIRVMAALYLLNIYYRDETHKFEFEDTSMGSDIFSIKKYSPYGIFQKLVDFPLDKDGYMYVEGEMKPTNTPFILHNWIENYKKL